MKMGMSGEGERIGGPRLGDLRALFSERIVFLDGAMGTMIQRLKLKEVDKICKAIIELV